MGQHVEGDATHATSPLHCGLLPGNALKKISELTTTSTVDQQPCGKKDDHDIIPQLEAQNHDQFEMIKDIHPEFQRLCGIHASSALAPKNKRLPLVSGNQSQAEDYDSVDKGLFNYLYKRLKGTMVNTYRYSATCI